MQNNENFFDKRTILAIALVGIVFFGWQSYLAKKYPQATKKAPDATATVATEGNKTTEPAATTAENKPSATSKENIKAETPEQLISVTTPEMSFEISSKGMGLKNIKLLKQLNRENHPILLGETENKTSFSLTTLEGSPIAFEINKISDLEYQGRGVSAGTEVVRQIKIDPTTYSISNKVQILNPAADFKGFAVYVGEKKIKEVHSSFLMPSFEHQELLIQTTNSTERTNVTSLKEDLNAGAKNAILAGISSQYFTSTVLDKSEITPEVRATSAHSGPEIDLSIEYRPASLAKQMEFNFISFSGPKSFQLLKRLDDNLTHVINYGFFASIAKVLLMVLQWFHSFVGNWGWSIIFLTLVVRLLVLPFNIASYKSMKKMQKIQPLIQQLRERHKEDPQAMNREMMLLMKEQKVNPLGGCLPMLLQMPVFFALYQVLGQSVELYKAPFFLWISDLSLKDPFYVLPVLMGLAMFAQQKLTPTTMDPAQAKILQWMPVVFSFMMISLPSGLTLYIFISTLFGVIQQQIFMRDKASAIRISEAKA